MFDAYLKMEDLDGGSTSEAYEGHIEVVRFEHEIHQEETSSRSMAAHGAAGRARHGALKIYKTLDRSTPWLAQVCSSGDNVKTCKLVLVQAIGDMGEKAVKNELLTIYLTDVRVSSIALEGGRETEPKEVVGLSYDTIYWEYKTIEGGSNIGSWNLTTNAVEAPTPE